MRVLVIEDDLEMAGFIRKGLTAPLSGQVHADMEIQQNQDRPIKQPLLVPAELRFQSPIS